MVSNFPLNWSFLASDSIRAVLEWVHGRFVAQIPLEPQGRYLDA